MTDTNPPQDQTPECQTALPLAFQVAAQERHLEFLLKLDSMLAPDEEVSDG